MLLVGSRALKFHYPDAREPRDWDIMASDTEIEEWVSVNKSKVLMCLPGDGYIEPVMICSLDTHDTIEFMIYNEYYLPASNQTLDFYGTALPVAAPSTLMAFKMSHLFRPIHWHKHIRDYHFLKGKGVVLNDADENVRLCRAELHDFDDPRNTMDVGNEVFFKRSEHYVRRTYVHDDIHQAVAYYDAPLFTRIKRDLTKALTSQRLFNKLSVEDQYRLVREEAYVIALERQIIPGALGKVKPVMGQQQAFEHALMLICTTLTAGWFTMFARENWPSIVKYDIDYVHKFYEAVAAGRVRESQ